MSSRHEAGVGEDDGDDVGEIVGELDGATVGDDDGPPLGPAVGDVDGPAVGPALGLVLGAHVGAAVSHRPLALQRPLVQSRPSAHFLPSTHGGHDGPPQSTEVSSKFCVLSTHVLSAIGWYTLLDLTAVHRSFSHGALSTHLRTARQWARPRLLSSTSRWSW